MGWVSIDDMVSEMTAGKTWRADFAKLPTGIGTVVAGRWYDLTRFPGTPPAYIHGNMVSNYDFVGGTVGWTLSADLVWTAATHLITKGNTGVETISQNTECLAGATYQVMWTIGSYAGSGDISLSIGGGVAVTQSSNGAKTDTVTCGSDAGATLLISMATTITACTIDLIYVRRLLNFTPYSDTGTGKEAGLWHGGAVTADTKHVLNIGAWTNVAAGAPSVLMLVDMLGCYPKIATDSSSLQTLGNNDRVSNGTFTDNANGWTVGAGWTYNSNAVDKDGDGTATLAQTTAIAAVAGKTYLVRYTISGWSVGSVTSAFGGVSAGAARSADGTYCDIITASGAGDLTFTPSNTARFTIDNVSVGDAPPRYGDGKGVRAYYVLGSLNGANAQNCAMTYTNTTPTTGRSLGATVSNLATGILGHILHSGVLAGNFGPFLPLASGDAGLVSAEGVTFSAAGAAAGGYVDLVLCKPIATLPLTAAFYAAERDLLNQLPSLPQIKDGAVLGFIIFAGAVISATTQYQGYVDLGWG